jgi:hypothetical protein
MKRAPGFSHFSDRDADFMRAAGLIAAAVLAGVIVNCIRIAMVAGGF